MHDGAPIPVLREEQRLITALLDVLREEQQYLVAADIDKLTPLTPHKAELVNAMAALSVQRHAALARDGFAAGEAGMAPWLAAHGTPEDHALWQQVLEQTREAKELNRLNGMLINKQLAHTQSGLQALRPQPQGGAVYGPSGRTSTSTTSRGFLAG